MENFTPHLFYDEIICKEPVHYENKQSAKLNSNYDYEQMPDETKNIFIDVGIEYQ
jgi:hypothetical protein